MTSIATDHSEICYAYGHGNRKRLKLVADVLQVPPTRLLYCQTRRVWMWRGFDATPYSLTQPRSDSVSLPFHCKFCCRWLTDVEVLATHFLKSGPSLTCSTTRTASAAIAHRLRAARTFASARGCCSEVSAVYTDLTPHCNYAHAAEPIHRFMPMLCPCCSVVAVGRGCLVHHLLSCMRVPPHVLGLQCFAPRTLTIPILDSHSRFFPISGVCKPQLLECLTCDCAQVLFEEEGPHVTMFQATLGWITFVTGLYSLHKLRVKATRLFTRLSPKLFPRTLLRRLHDLDVAVYPIIIDYLVTGSTDYMGFCWSLTNSSLE